jgi:retron-type reverse transcriptase
LFHSYHPKPLKTFIIHDPKTRKISKSDFRDRVVHHALCNVIEPIFDRTFIFDSYANRVGKGTFAAISRFDHFKRKVSKNNSQPCYVLKADIRKYFENVDHRILLGIISKKIKDAKVLWLIRRILENSSPGKGMPLGNLTSQFFANVYLNELDQFIKQQLKAKYYIRYVDDFVILHHKHQELEKYHLQIDEYLQSALALLLHPDKSKILRLGNRITFLGFRMFYHHKLLKRSNLKKLKSTLKTLTAQCHACAIHYDPIYDYLEGWVAYAQHANTYKNRKYLLQKFEAAFQREISTKEINRHLKFIPSES